MAEPTSRIGLGVMLASLAGGRADPHAMRSKSEQGLLEVGVDHWYLQNAGDDVVGEDDGGGPPKLSGQAQQSCADETHVMSGGVSYFLRTKGNSERNIAILSQEFMAGGYTRQIVRSDGVAAMVSRDLGDGGRWAVRAHAKKNRPRKAGRAVKEVNAKIRTLEYELEKGLTHTVADNHDTLAWLVQHEAATVIKRRTGVDGRTPFHRRRDKSFQRVVASHERQEQ